MEQFFLFLSEYIISNLCALEWKFEYSNTTTLHMLYTNYISMNLLSSELLFSYI